ncbi:hypothetical protein GCM10012290_06980 [Halolactibacillus alkaliphilus]|uniref:DNA-binding response regulator n=1 Tax=Halolactibacillus alkaliphilus TaxID=442899 RepID=A0A511WZN7_9BACI|nr:response regulator [Halolactibacillus alkaliphilus]GEN56148.1 hypothetical protein HAL01_06120 [Halolactibacillus alkaliphilus]GGN66882.1 hypothetical protein GCM10012290_06980 [Halolactibacillus alkaliphilus]SFO71938.1 two component transcriptional regulator, AraC family [Halolactibacillus alkaliphilus]
MYRVMIVDDWEIFLTQLKRKADWEGLGFTIVHEASNGKEALNYLLTHPVDVVITDIRMPEMDGIDLLKAIRANHLNTHVIFLSEYEDFQYAKQAIHYQITDYLIKPVQANELTTRLQTLKSELNQRDTIETTTDQNIVEALIRDIQLKKSPQPVIESFIMDTTAKVGGDRQRVFDDYRSLTETLKNKLLQIYPWLSRFLVYPEMTNEEKLEDLHKALINVIDGFTQPIHTLYYSALHQVLIEKVCSFALASDEKFTIKTIADSLFVNKNYLADTFKKETGITLGDYLTKVKIKRAQVLLQTTQLKLYEISDQLGYRHPEYFSRVFKKETGLTPQTYRDQHA